MPYLCAEAIVVADVTETDHPWAAFAVEAAHGLLAAAHG